MYVVVLLKRFNVLSGCFETFQNFFVFVLERFNEKPFLLWKVLIDRKDSFRIGKKKLERICLRKRKL